MTAAAPVSTMISGEHELWNAYMATGRTRAQLEAIAALGRQMSAALQPLAAAVAAVARFADAVHLPAAPVPAASPSRARAPGIPQKENDASDRT